jgi:hypothetical protein
MSLSEVADVDQNEQNKTNERTMTGNDAVVKTQVRTWWPRLLSTDAGCKCGYTLLRNAFFLSNGHNGEISSMQSILYRD